MEPGQDNPFASPVDTSQSLYRTFHVEGSEVIAKERFQAIIAAILSLFFAVVTTLFFLSANFGLVGGAISLTILGFMLVSCLATTANHWYRASRVPSRFPLTIDEDGIQAKFEQGDTFVSRTIPWNQITNVRFAPRDQMIVTDTDSKESVADLRLLGNGRWKPLRDTLKFFSDQMAQSED